MESRKGSPPQGSMVKPENMTVQDVIAKMGEGQPLRVPYNNATFAPDSGAILAAGHRPGSIAIPIPRELALAVIASGQVHKLTQFGEPPVEQRQRHEGYRCGWRELGWDGSNADYYCLMQ
jgi:hypothetical protein